MKTIIKWFFAFLAFSYLFLLYILDDSFEYHYKSYVEAERDNLFLRGWLPDFIPKSSREIQISGNTELNSAIGSFSINAGDYLKFSKHLTEIKNKHVESERVYEYHYSGQVWIFLINAKSGLIKFETDEKRS